MKVRFLADADFNSRVIKGLRRREPLVDFQSAEEKSDWGVIKEKIRVDLKRYISKQTSKRPLILPVILEV